MFDTQLMRLKRVLDSNHIDRSMYSLNGYADERVCLEKFGDGWDVYIGERGIKYDLKHYSSFNTACIRLIEELAESADEERKMKYDYFSGFSNLNIRLIFTKRVQSKRHP